MMAATTFIVSLVTGIASTWGVRNSAVRLGIVDRPNPIIPQHRRPISMLGGIAIFLASAAMVGIQLLIDRNRDGLPTLNELYGLCAGALVFVALGLWDDLRRLRAGAKLALQVVAAIIAVGVQSLRSGGNTPGWEMLVAVGLIIVMVNAVNVTDVCDGLVSGIACVTFAALSILDPGWGTLWLVWVGVTAGFLVFNAPPASIFLGDAGSHLIGFILAAGMIRTVSLQGPWPGVGTAILGVVVFLFEATFIAAHRRRRGIPWWRGSPDHFSLRLQAAGFSRWTTVVAAWGVAGVLAVVAVSLDELTQPGQVLAVAGVLAIITISWRFLSRLPFPVVTEAPTQTTSRPTQVILRIHDH
jgi:UDP-GlcNAc:undecaprenyl-phosphate/decaprenyl-phosphate GlcNAc-1-phosphate transferase